MKPASPRSKNDAPAGNSRRALLHLVAFCAFCLLFAAIRVPFATALTLDDAVERYLAQQWSLSYGVGNPPLHTWLFSALEAVLGPGLLTSQLLDTALLVVTFGAMLSTGRAAGLSFRASAAGAWSLLLVPPVTLSLSVYTDTTLLLCLTALTLRAAVAVNESPNARSFTGLGVMCAVGTLTNYNFLVVPASIALTALTLPRWRASWGRATFVYALLPSVLVWPVVTGFMDQVEPQLARLVEHRLALQSLGLEATAAGLWELLKALVVYAGPLALALALARPSRQVLRNVPASVIFLGHISAAALLLVVAGILVSGISDFPPRYLHVALLPLPLLAAAWAAAGRPRPPVAYVGALLAGGALVLADAAWEVSDACPGACEERIPYPALVQSLGPLPPGTTLLTDDPLTAGNLAARLPATRVVNVEAQWRPDRPQDIFACFAIVDPAVRPDVAPEELFTARDPATLSTAKVEAPFPGPEGRYEWRISRTQNPSICP
ncbi:MAG: glycosyltransferase family 39 protein [Gammaproteobacteria bacterium]